MQIEISEYNKHLVLAGNGNSLRRYVVKGDELKTMFATFERIPYIGRIECFECYVKNPETGEGGWDIVWIEGVEEKIKAHYPHFDCFITKGYPVAGNEVVEFHSVYAKDDYKMAEFES